MHRKVKSTNSLEHFEKDVQKIGGEGWRKLTHWTSKGNGEPDARDCGSVKEDSKAGREEGMEKWPRHGQEG